MTLFCLIRSVKKSPSFATGTSSQNQRWISYQTALRRAKSVSHASRD